MSQRCLFEKKRFLYFEILAQFIVQQKLESAKWAREEVYSLAYEIEKYKNQRKKNDSK